MVTNESQNSSSTAVQAEHFHFWNFPQKCWPISTIRTFRQIRGCRMPPWLPSSGGGGGRQTWTGQLSSCQQPSQLGCEESGNRTKSWWASCSCRWRWTSSRVRVWTSRPVRWMTSSGCRWCGGGGPSWWGGSSGGPRTKRSACCCSAETSAKNILFVQTIR